MTIAPRLKYPDRMSGEDWPLYLRAAINRATGTPWKAAKWEVKDWSNKLMENARGVDQFVMALAVDVMAMSWTTERALSPQRALSHARMLRWYYNMRRPRWFWRAVWFSRYARTPAEVAYYREWLEQAETALDASDGYGGKRELLSRSKRMLAGAEAEITGRGEAPTFMFDWLAVKREELCQ